MTKNDDFTTSHPDSNSYATDGGPKGQRAKTTTTNHATGGGGQYHEFAGIPFTFEPISQRTPNMTHSPEVEALVKASERAKSAMLKTDDDALLPHVKALREALAALEPKQVMVPVLPEWDSFCRQMCWHDMPSLNIGNNLSVRKEVYEQLRVLTAQPEKAKEIWVPEKFEDLPPMAQKWYKNGTYNQHFWPDFRAALMGLKP